MKKTITLVYPDDVADYTCDCGNTADTDGFETCDSKGNLMEPLTSNGWDSLYRCNKCGNIHRIC